MRRMAISPRAQLLLAVGGVLAVGIVLALVLAGGTADGDRIEAAPSSTAPESPDAAAPAVTDSVTPEEGAAVVPSVTDDVTADETPAPPPPPPTVPPAPVLAAAAAPARPTAPAPAPPESDPQPAAASTVRDPVPTPAPEAAEATQAPSDNRENGIYLVRGVGSQQLLVPSVVSSIGEEGGGLFSRPQVFAVVNGLKASLRSREHYQTFEFVFPEGGAAITGQVTHPNQYVLIQLYEEAEFAERTFDVLPGGLDSEVIVPFRTEQVDSRTYRVTPVEPLGLGEFCFFILEAGADVRAGLTLFDFGIDP